MNNSIINKISEYFDEGLPPHEEEILFKELSASPEARKVFNEYLKIFNGLSSDAHSLTPPAESTEKIFSKLGFSFPNVDPTVNTTDSENHAKRKFSRSYLLLLILTFTSCISLLTIAISNILDDKDLTSEAAPGNIENNSGQQLTSNTHNNLDNTDSYIITDNNNNNNYEKTYKPERRDIQRHAENIYRLNTNASINTNNNISTGASNSSGDHPSDFVETLYADNSPEVLISRDIDKIIDKLLPISLESDANFDYTIADKFTENFPTTSNNLPSLTEIDKKYANKINKPTRYMFVISKSISGAAPPLGISPNNSVWNNSTMKFNYKLNNSHIIGAEIGWQDFPQIFTRTIDQTIFEQKQMPMLFYGSALYSYNFAPILNLDIVEPFSQISIGGTSIGPVFGVSIGTYVNIYNHFGLNLTGNLDMLLYNVENKIYNSDKFGVKVGVFYGF